MKTQKLSIIFALTVIISIAILTGCQSPEPVTTVDEPILVEPGAGPTSTTDTVPAN